MAKQSGVAPGEGLPPRGPQHHMVRGNADDTEVVPPNELLPAKSDACD